MHNSSFPFGNQQQLQQQQLYQQQQQQLYQQQQLQQQPQQQLYQQQLQQQLYQQQQQQLYQQQQLLQSQRKVRQFNVPRSQLPPKIPTTPIIPQFSTPTTPIIPQFSTSIVQIPQFSTPTIPIIPQFSTSIVQIPQPTILYHQPLNVTKRSQERANERVEHILNTLPTNVRITSLVDIGAGNAEITDQIVKRLGISSAYAIDVYPTSEFVRPSSDSIVQYIQVTGSTLPFMDDSIDMVTAFMAIHHIADTVNILKEICRILKPGGLFFFREHDVTNMDQTVYLNNIHSQYYQDPHQHSTNETHYWSREDLLSFLTQHGFKKIGDSGYDPKKNPQAIYHSMFTNVNCKSRF